jgi:LPXTG-motif cell wall-anchored protein
MLLVSGLLLVIGSLINHLSGNEVNLWYLGFGLLMLIFSTAMLLFYKKK